MNTMSVSATGSPSSISSTQRCACGEPRSFRTSIQTLVSTTITSARGGSRQGRPPTGHAPADRAHRYVGGEQPTHATPHRPLRASSERQSTPGLRGAHGRRSQCSFAYTRAYTSEGVYRREACTERGGFEPPNEVSPVTRFPVAPVQPLRHLSGCLFADLSSAAVTQGYDTHALLVARLRPWCSPPAKRSSRPSA